MLMAASQAAAEVGPDYMLGEDMLLLYMEQLSEDLKVIPGKLQCGAWSVPFTGNWCSAGRLCPIS